MRISGKRRQAIYDAIAEQVMRARIDIAQNDKKGCDLDARVAKIEWLAFRAVMAALGAKEVE